MSQSYHSYFFAFLFLVLVGLTVASCSYDHSHSSPAISVEPETSSTQWTILYYGAGNCTEDLSGNMTSEVFETVRRFEEDYFPDQISVLACAGSAATHDSCQLYKVGFHPNHKSNEISSDKLENWGRLDMSSPATLKRFIEFGLANAPAAHYMLVVGGNGSGWRGVCKDESSGIESLMKLPEMNAILGNSTTVDGHPLRFDLLVWLTPGMSDLEVAYQFRNTAEYMVAGQSAYSLSGMIPVNLWMHDLACNPGMSADQLGRFITSRMSTDAITQGDTLASFSLYDLTQVSALAGNVGTLADSIQANLQGHNSEILTLWQSLRDVRTDDSSTVDLMSFVHALSQNAYFGTVPGIVGAAHEVESQFPNFSVDTRTTRSSLTRKGLMIYSPVDPAPADTSAYGALSMSTEQPKWRNFVSSVQSSPVEFTGSVRWAGHDIREKLYVFLNIAQFGIPEATAITPLTVSQIASEDNIQFAASVILDSVSIDAYVGVFQDLNNDHQLSTGDRYGYYHNLSPQRDWLTIHRGDRLDSLTIVLTATR